MGPGDTFKIQGIAASMMQTGTGEMAESESPRLEKSPKIYSAF
jgi:hypothetical protein